MRDFAAADVFRHPDGTPHDASGPLGCFSCANMRRAVIDGLVAMARAIRDRCTTHPISDTPRARGTDK